MIRKYATVWMLCFGALISACSQESPDELLTKGEDATHSVSTYPQAERYLVKFLDIYPGDPRADVALQALARVLLGQKKHQDAIQRYDELVTRFPNSRYVDQAQFMVGYIHEEQGRLDLAREAYLKLIEAYPESDLIDDARASVENLGKVPEAWLFPDSAHAEAGE